MVAIWGACDPLKVGEIGYLTSYIEHLDTAKISQIDHSVPRVILTPQISKVNQISIFILVWVVRITPYAQSCPIPSPFLLIFSKNGFEVKLNIENWRKYPKLLMYKNVNMGGRNWTKLSIGGDSHNPSEYEIRCLIHLRNLGGHYHSGHPPNF